MKTPNKKNEIERMKVIRIKIRGPDYPIGL
ncbi:hypothetical protein LCGC14_0606690 [marine sediment metagenome]|uniref:Uncharacterized protein n=1 Tax=marine sediment metagenome TaxID=412755 RepID=A0A0F9TV55_9ZZZZ